MSFNPGPLDTKGKWKEYEFCINCVDSGMVGGPEINLIYRNGDAWFPVGVSDGMLYTNDKWDANQWPSILWNINERLKTKCLELDASALPLSFGVIGEAPREWHAFKSWLKSAGAWIGQPHQRLVFPLYVNRAFAGGHAFDFGINEDGSPACRVMVPDIGWKVAEFK